MALCKLKRNRKQQVDLENDYEQLMVFQAA